MYGCSDIFGMASARWFIDPDLFFNVLADFLN
jgi:hypothetical protein